MTRASGYDLLYRRNSVTEVSSGAAIAAWQFFGSRTAALSLGNALTCSFMNNAQTRSAIQLGQPTPPWGDIGTDQLGYDGAGRLIGKRYFNGSAVMVGNTSAYDKSSNKLFERALHAESRSNLYPAYDLMDRLLEYQRGILASGGGSITTPISLPGTNQEQDYNLDALGNWSTTTITDHHARPQDIDSVVLPLQVLDLFLEACDRATLQAEHLKKVIPEALRFFLLTAGILPLMRETNGVLTNLLQW